MLYALGRHLGRIASGELDERTLYAQSRHHRVPRPRRVAPGVLVCPICGLSARRFLRFGLAGRRNAVCPGCGSVERHRLLWLYLTRSTDLMRRRYRILHTAAEPALQERLKPRHGRRYVTLDRDDPDADIRADLTRLPFPDGHFDVILSSHVLEHVRDDQLAMAELARVLRPGGWAVLMVPFDPTSDTREDRTLDTPAARLAAYGHPFHYRIYGRDLPDRLALAGLAARILAADRLLTPHLKRRHRVNANFLLLCRKAGQ
ncbi:MAG: methyltransferase domain-containing protein [Azospirillum sp.]|nr:methyltransferase domain-containing protein [Azospirillum sp.]